MSISLNTTIRIKYNNRKRVGRGIGSGTGKTSGHGVKGQKARSGVALGLFEGGQTPIYMRLPKKGFKNFCRKEYEVVNVRDVLTLVANKTLDGSSDITKEKLLAAGLVRNVASKVKLIMGKQKVEKADVKVIVDSYSKTAEIFSK